MIRVYDPFSVRTVNTPYEIAFIKIEIINNIPFTIRSGIDPKGKFWINVIISNIWYGVSIRKTQVVISQGLTIL